MRLKHRCTAILLATVFSLTACNMPLVRPRLTPTPRPTRTPLPLPESIPTVTLPPDPSREPTATLSPNWETLLPGFDLRLMQIEVEGFSRPVDLTLVRVDPALFVFQVHYTPGDLTTVADWQARTGALLVVNGGFYMTDKRPLGLVVVDGEPLGQSFEGHGGMLSVVGDVVSVRSLAVSPYRPGERLDQAVQGRPMLLDPGGLPADFDLAPEPARRTAVAQDRQGRIVFVVSDYGALSLYDLRDWLAETVELDLAIALNLDGGGSTGLALNAGGRSYLINSWSVIPGVIAVYLKS